MNINEKTLRLLCDSSLKTFLLARSLLNQTYQEEDSKESEYPVVRAETSSKSNLDNITIETENTDFKAVKPIKEEKEEMPPKYSDGSFRELASGLLEYRFRHNGKTISKYGKSKKDCWEKRTEVISGKVKTKKATQITYIFSEWLTKWYNTYKVRKDGSKINARSEYDMKLHIFPSKLGQMPLKSITGIDIQDFLKNFDDRPNVRGKLADIINPSLKKPLLYK